MLLPYTTLAYYGEAAAATYGNEAGSLLVADIKAMAAPASEIIGEGIVSYAKPTMLVNRPATLEGIGAITGASPKLEARPSSTIRVNALSQDDVTGAVFESEIEPGVSLKEALRQIRAALDGTVDANVISIKGQTITGSGVEADPWSPA